MLENEILLRLDTIMKSRGISRYELSKRADIPYSSLASIYRKNNKPTLDTLSKLCKGLDITISDFFNEERMVDKSVLLNDKEMAIIEMIRKTDDYVIEYILGYLKGIFHEKL